MTDNLLVTDAHCHVYPEAIAKKASDHTGTFYGETPAHGGTTEELIRSGTEAGVDRFLIQSVATAPKQVKSINEFIANETKKYPDKFIGFGTLHPESENLKEDFLHAYDLGLHGIKLHPDCQKFLLDDEKCDMIYSLCSEYDMPLLVHLGDKRYEYSSPLRMMSVMHRFDKLKVIGAHLGGWSLWEELPSELFKIKNLWVDCSSSIDYIPIELSKEIFSRYGADKILFGTDYPLHSPKNVMAILKKMDLPRDDMKKILNDNFDLLIRK